MSGLNSKRVAAQVDKFIGYYEAAKGRNPERLNLYSSQVEALTRGKLVINGGYRGIPIVEMADGAADD